MTDDAREYQWGVKANMRGAHRFIRLGAKCLLLGHPQWRESVEVRALSRSGRTVSAWVSPRDLENFRPEWISPVERNGRQTTGLLFRAREEAQAWADEMNAEYGSKPLRRSAWFRGTATAEIETTETAP